MLYKQLNNKTKIPMLGFGTWQLKPVIEAPQAVLSALQDGYRHIDTAHIYFNEGSVGKSIIKSSIPRDEIFIATKLWNFDHHRVESAYEQSLKKLQVDYVDLYLMHYPVTKSRISAWKDMEKLYKQNRVKSIGVSNFTVKHLEELLEKTDIVPSVNQVEFHPFLYQKELLDFCNKHGIALEAYSPLSHGKRLNDNTLSDIAAKHSKTVAQVMIRWSLQHGNIVIPKSKNPDRIKQNFDVFNFQITDSDMEKIDNLNENLRTCWDPTNTP